MLAEEPVPAALIHKVLREATIHNMVVPVLCGSALDGIGVQPVLDAVAAYLPSPADVPPVEGVDPKKHDAKLDPQARPGRAVLRPGVQDSGRPARRPALRPRLLRRAEGQQPRLQSGQGQEGKRAATLAHPGRPPRAGRSGLGRRHHRHRRPAALDHRRHALRHPRPDPAGIDRLSRNRHLDGHRAGDLDRAQEAGRRAGDDEAAGPHLPRPRKRGDRPDAHQRHGRAAPGSDQAPAAARLQAQRPRPQAAGQLPRDDRAGGRSHRRVPPQRRRADALGQGPHPHGAVRARAPSRSPSSSAPRRRAARAVSHRRRSKCSPSRAKAAARWASR